MVWTPKTGHHADEGVKNPDKGRQDVFARRLGVSDLLLYHTQDRDLPRRKLLYTQQARQSFSGRVYIPDDLETLSL